MFLTIPCVSGVQHRGAWALTPSLDAHHTDCIVRDASTFDYTQPLSVWQSEQPLGLTKSTLPEEGKPGTCAHVPQPERRFSTKTESSGLASGVQMQVLCRGVGC